MCTYLQTECITKDDAVFTNMHFLYDNSIIFLHFKTHFQKFVFSGPQNAVVMYMNSQNPNKLFSF